MQPTESPLRQYLQILKRQAWIVLLVPVVTLAATFALLELRDPVYRASLTLVVGEQPRKDFPPELGSGSVTRTLTNLLESDFVARSVIRRTRLNVTTEKLREDLKVEVLPDTAVVHVTYDSTQPRVALTVVSELARIFTRQVDQTLGIETGGRRRGSFDLVVRVFDPPHLEAEPVSSNPVANLLFAGIAGLALGILLAVAREALDSRIRSRKDAELWFAAPVVGALPRGLGRRPPTAGAGGRREDRRTASLDLLRARLQFAHAGVAGNTILVTAPGAESGKSNVAANLSASLARAGKRVICVDADLRRPTLHRFLGLQTQAPGLADMIEAGVPLEEALIHVELAEPSTNGAAPGPASGRLEVLRAGSPPSRVGLLTPEAIEVLLPQLRERADYVVFDAPSLLVSDFFPLAVKSDNVLVVARRGRTTKEQAESAREALKGLGIEQVGIVLTDVPAGDGYA